MVKQRIPKVFFDANILISAGKPPGGPIMERVRDLVDSDMISVLTTDLTIVEVAKKHAANDFSIIAELGRPHFRKIVSEVLDLNLPDISKAELKERLLETYSASTNAMLDRLGAKMLEIDSVPPSAVFGAYASGEGFFAGEGKKDQFPDAFIFECLKAEANEKTPVIIVSHDGDFKKPSDASEHIALVKSVPELFAMLGLQVDAPQLGAFLTAHQPELVNLVTEEIDDWGLIGDVEDSEIYETEVTSVEVGDLTSFGTAQPGGPILAVGELKVTATINFTHPDWDTAFYDSEDKALIPWDTVDGATEIEFTVNVSMSMEVDNEGQPKEISELRFKNSNFQHVSLHPTEDYK